MILSLGFLTGGNVLGDMGLLLVNALGAETIAAPIISLTCCWLFIYKIILPQVVLAGDKMIMLHSLIYLS